MEDYRQRAGEFVEDYRQRAGEFVEDYRRRVEEHVEDYRGRAEEMAEDYKKTGRRAYGQLPSARRRNGRGIQRRDQSSKEETPRNKSIHAKKNIWRVFMQGAKRDSVFLQDCRRGRNC